MLSAQPGCSWPSHPAHSGCCSPASSGRRSVHQPQSSLGKWLVSPTSMSVLCACGHHCHPPVLLVGSMESFSHLCHGLSIAPQVPANHSIPRSSGAPWHTCILTEVPQRSSQPGAHLDCGTCGQLPSCPSPPSPTWPCASGGGGRWKDSLRPSPGGMARPTAVPSSRCLLCRGQSFTQQRLPCPE